MAEIQTVRGPIDSSQLGRVLIHEHIFVFDFEYVENYRPDWDEDREVAKAAARLQALKQAGIDTIIDLTVLGLGRQVKRIAKVAEKTDLQIIVATGAYTFDEAPTAFGYWGPGRTVDAPREPMIDLFVGDATEGIAGTGIRAGELKCAIDMPGLTEGVERVLRSIARTHIITGLPITVHTAPANRSGLIVQQVLEEEGVDLRDVIIGHCGDSTDLDYLMELADKGSILGMDRFGIEMACPTGDRIRTIAEMVKRGYADRMGLSHDCACWSHYFPSPEHQREHFPTHDYMHISSNVIPALREAGVSERELDMMFIDNPRRHFEGAAERFAARN